MLTKTTLLYGIKLNGSDGDLGTIEDFYFDDKSWTIRYIIAETGNWLNERQVLISPNSILRLDLDDNILIVNLTQKQIEESPPISRHRPVSRQFEEQYHHYYGWPYYWTGDSILGLGGYPMDNGNPRASQEEIEENRLRDDTHLGNTFAVSGYAIVASDGTIGHVTDFLVDDKTWAIQDLVVEAGHWYSGKEILISPNKIKCINYNESEIHVYLTKEDIKLTDEHHIAHAHRH
jgi:uncharacterized protein YrrD